MIYIYGLKCPIAGVIRYVGKSIQPELRAAQHVRDCMRLHHHTARWVRTLRAVGLEPESCVTDDENWRDIERAFIAGAEERGWKLTNSTEGGEGFASLPIGDARMREKRSTSLKRTWNRPEVKAEAKQRGLKAWSDPVAGARRRAAITAPNVRAKQSVAAKARWSDPVKGAAARQSSSSTEKRHRLSDAAIRRATPEYRSMMAEKTRVSWGKRRIG